LLSSIYKGDVEDHALAIDPAAKENFLDSGRKAHDATAIDKKIIGPIKDLKLSPTTR
jgi:hypothetical protein